MIWFQDTISYTDGLQSNKLSMQVPAKNQNELNQTEAHWQPEGLHVQQIYNDNNNIINS